MSAPTLRKSAMAYVVVSEAVVDSQWRTETAAETRAAFLNRWGNLGLAWTVKAKEVTAG